MKCLLIFLLDQQHLYFQKMHWQVLEVIRISAKKNEKLKFITASLDKKIIEFKEFETLAKLPSLEELRAKIVGYITAPHQQLIKMY